MFYPLLYVILVNPLTYINIWQFPRPKCQVGFILFPLTKLQSNQNQYLLLPKSDLFKMAPLSDQK